MTATQIAALKQTVAETLGLSAIGITGLANRTVEFYPKKQKRTIMWRDDEESFIYVCGTVRQVSLHKKGQATVLRLALNAPSAGFHFDLSGSRHYVLSLLELDLNTKRWLGIFHNDNRQELHWYGDVQFC